MLEFLLSFIKLVAVPLLYLGGIVVMLVTVFKNTKWGLLLMLLLIPQPNIWFKFHSFPMGNYYINFIFLSVLAGIFIQRKGLEGTYNSLLILAFIIVSYFALWNSSMRFLLPAPITPDNPLFKDWKNYAMMIATYFLALNAIKDERDQKWVVVIMCLVVLLISIRSFRAYTGGETYTGSRYGGPFETVGLGANHLGAFIADYGAVFLGLFLFDKGKRRKALYLITVLFCVHPLFFSYSRGAYIAALGAVAFLGILKKRRLLVAAVIVLLFWQTLLPVSVVDRIQMTETESGELEHSSALRLVFWNLAVESFEQNPIFGIGFRGFGYAAPEEYQHPDVHNLYLKTLCEQGIVGFTFLLLIFFAAFWSGWKLWSIGKTTFHRGLGFGFIGCIIALIVTNMFGDRWSYIELGTYFWIFWGMVDRGILISRAVTSNEDSKPLMEEGTILIKNGASGLLQRF